LAYLIGTDEAGYGPNLGPLVVSATVWQIEDDETDVDLYERLEAAVTRHPPAARELNDPRIAIADSKALYNAARGLAALERSVLAVLGATDRCSESWRAVWSHLAPDAIPALDSLPWYAGFDRPLPIVSTLDAPSDRSLTASERFRAALGEAGVTLRDMRSRVVCPREFNALVERHGTKGGALSAVTLELLDAVVPSIVDVPVLCHCDKHGGRNRYAALLKHVFAAHRVEVVEEGAARSAYHLRSDCRPFEVRFETKAERWLPVALASMLSKYLRELAMMAFNDFWCGRVEGLRPTAGYPQDAKRFKAQIATVQQASGIAEEVLWRSR